MENNNIIITEGFVWLIVPERQIKPIFWTAVFSLVAVFDDGTDSTIDSEEYLNEMMELEDVTICIEVGHIEGHEDINQWPELTE